MSMEGWYRPVRLQGLVNPEASCYDSIYGPPGMKPSGFVCHVWVVDGFPGTRQHSSLDRFLRVHPDFGAYHVG
jgi:hypothetical protein